MLEEYLPFFGLIIFGNIENLILSSQGVVKGVNPRILGGLSIIIVLIIYYIKEIKQKYIKAVKDLS